MTAGIAADADAVVAISEEEADSRAKAERQAAAGIQSSLASLEVSKLNMEYTRVTAPISGRITKLLVTPGQHVEAKDLLVAIAT